MNKFEWIFFDLDGTLADSLEIMYDIYIEFLKDYGIKGTAKEFQKLNGPSLKEIIIFLKKKYELKPTTKELLEKYQKMIEESYKKKVRPIKGSTSLLKKLHKRNYKLALVSSSNHNVIQDFLKRNNWLEYFSIVISGDDAAKAKPSPDLYNLCISRTKGNRKKILVIEDSKKGFESALKAGLKCILLDSKNKNLNSVTQLC